MIHVVGVGNFDAYHHILEHHYLVRHRVFVDERGWQDLRRADGREIDAYDTERTVYLLAIEGGRVVGGHRLMPTTGPHMLADVFPFLADFQVPSGPTIMEWSRFFIVPERRGGPTYFKLMAAVQEYCLRRSITHVTAVVEAWWLAKFDKAGFTYRALGQPSLIEGIPTSAILIDIRRDSLRRVMELGGLTESVLAGCGPEGPAAEPEPWDVRGRASPIPLPFQERAAHAPAG